jgi:hypothetical protein
MGLSTQSVIYFTGISTSMSVQAPNIPPHMSSAILAALTVLGAAAFAIFVLGFGAQL